MKKKTAKKKAPERAERREVSIPKKTEAQKMRHQFYNSRHYLAERRDRYFDEIADGLLAELKRRKRDRLALRECVDVMVAAGLYSEFIPKKSIDHMVLRKLWRWTGGPYRGQTFRKFVAQVAPDYSDEEKWFENDY